MARVPASIRSKNPGAMWGSALAKKWGATRSESLNDGTGQGNNIAWFPTYVQGICAQLDLWRTSKNYRNKRFADAIAIWSGGNHVESYIKFVCDRVPGMTRNTIMDDTFWRSPMGIGFLKAQAWHEAGRPYPAPDADWLEAQRIVFSGAVPVTKPPVTASTKTGVVIVTTTTAATTTAAQSGVSGWTIAIGVAVVLISAGVGLYFWHRHEKAKLKEAERPALVGDPEPQMPVGE